MATAKNFETALHHLEQAVEQLESGELPLEQALKVFSTGVKQAETCRRALQEVELKVEQLTQGNNGTFRRDDLDET